MVIDLYRVLGVERSADARVLRHAYLSQMKRFHPDRLGPDGADDPRAREINHAFSVLRNPDHRAVYDRELAAQAEAYWLREWEQQRQAALRRNHAIVRRTRRRGKVWRTARVLLALAALAGTAYLYDETSRQLTIPTVLDVGQDDPFGASRAEAAAPVMVPVSPSIVTAALIDYEWISTNFGLSGLNTHAAQCWEKVRRVPSFALLNRCAAFDVAADVYAGNLERAPEAGEAAYFSRTAREDRYNAVLAALAEEADPISSLALIEGVTITAMVDRLERKPYRAQATPAPTRL